MYAFVRAFALALYFSNVHKWGVSIKDITSIAVSKCQHKKLGSFSFSQYNIFSFVVLDPGSSFNDIF